MSARRLAARSLVAATLLVAGSVLAAQGPDSAAAARQHQGVQAFQQISAVLLHPRCLNCHTNGDYPTQGDDRHPHLFRVVRGGENRGAAGMHCSTCHQTANNPSNGVPGAKGWELAPLSMGWEGRTARELCEQLKDPERNGGLDLPRLAQHFGTDARVAWGWVPGNGRTPVNAPKESFLAAVAAWVSTGAACPQ
jgi:hypothetical protein